MNLYKALWSRIGGRPWTYIRRDFWHQNEIVNIVFFVSIGFVSGLHFWKIYLFLANCPYCLIALVSFFYFLGVLQEHFYGGREWVEGQKGENKS